jgi:hypothetical protein
MASKPRPSAFLDNLKKPMPAGKKLKVISRNYWRRFVLLQPCCGHPGEPGC